MTAVFHFKSPPLPFFIEAVQLTINKGQSYPARANIGVFKLVYVKKGRLNIFEQQTSYSLNQGNFILLQPKTTCIEHSRCEVETIVEEIQFSATAPWELVNHDVSPQLFGDYYSHIIHVKKIDNFNIQNKRKWEALLDKLKLAAQSGEAESFIQRQQHFISIINFLDNTWRQLEAKSAVLVAEKAAAFIKGHYKQNMTNTMLSSHLGYHINYITRCMDEVFGMTPQQYLMFFRLDQAKLLLIHTEQSIADIALATGFKQTPHFSRLFAQYVGISPLKYRKKYMS